MADEESDNQRIEELIQISKNLQRVPWNPPETFYESMQFLWFTQDVALVAFGLGGIFGIGRPDQYLYPFFERDIESGAI